MTTETKQKDSPKEASKKGLIIGAKVAAFGAVASIAIVLMQPELPECASKDATDLASLHLNANKLMRMADARVESLQGAELVASNEAGDILGCRATMNTTTGKSFPVVYRIEWENESEGIFVVQADLDR